MLYEYTWKWSEQFFIYLKIQSNKCNWIQLNLLWHCAIVYGFSSLFFSSLALHKQLKFYLSISVSIAFANKICFLSLRLCEVNIKIHKMLFYILGNSRIHSHGIIFFFVGDYKQFPEIVLKTDHLSKWSFKIKFIASICMQCITYSIFTINSFSRY